MGYQPPTVTDIRDASSMIFAEYGYKLPEDPDPDPLELLVTEAIAELYGTLLFQAQITLDFDKIHPETMIGGYIAQLLDTSIRMWVEWLVTSGQRENADIAGDIDMHSSSGRGGQSRRPLSSNLQMWHVWPKLDRLLHFIVKIYSESIDPTIDQTDLPAVSNPGPTPKPGQWYMDRARDDRDHSPFEAPLSPGVARVMYGS